MIHLSHPFLYRLILSPLRTYMGTYLPKNFGLNNNGPLLISEQQQPTVDLSLARANFAGRGNSRGGGGGRQNSSPALGRGSPSSHQKNNRGQGHGRGNGNSSSTTRPVCVVCNKTGHSALNCYHQYMTIPIPLIRTICQMSREVVHLTT